MIARKMKKSTTTLEITYALIVQHQEMVDIANDKFETIYNQYVINEGSDDFQTLSRSFLKDIHSSSMIRMISIFNSRTQFVHYICQRKKKRKKNCKISNSLI